MVVHEHVGDQLAAQEGKTAPAAIAAAAEMSTACATHATVWPEHRRGLEGRKRWLGCVRECHREGSVAAATPATVAGARGTGAAAVGNAAAERRSAQDGVAQLTEVEVAADGNLWRFVHDACRARAQRVIERRWPGGALWFLRRALW